VLQILGRPRSINVRKVLWLCVELGVSHELVLCSPDHSSPAAAEFLALNPNGLVPVIRDGAFVLWESNAICRYLAMKAGRIDLLPEDPRARALIEQWMDWQATELNYSWRYAFMALVRQSGMHRDSEAITSSVASWNRNMQIAERQLRTTGAYMIGATFTLADIVVGLGTHRWLMTPIDRPDLPAVRAYYDRLTQREGFRLHARSDTP